MRRARIGVCRARCRGRAETAQQFAAPRDADADQGKCYGIDNLRGGELAYVTNEIASRG